MSRSTLSQLPSITYFFWDSPFDTGDRVFIDEGNFVVKKMGLFAVGLPCYFGRAPFLTLA